MIRSDEPPKGAFFLVEGVIRRYIISHYGEELTLAIYKPMSFFPWSWVINGTVLPHCYEAMTPVTVYKAPREDVLNFLKSEPDIAMELLSRFLREFEEIWMKMEYLMSGSAYKN